MRDILGFHEMRCDEIVINYALRFCFDSVFWLIRLIRKVKNVYSLSNGKLGLADLSVGFKHPKGEMKRRKARIEH